MPNLAAEFRSAIQAEHPGAVQVDRGYDWLRFQDGAKQILAIEGGGLHYMDGDWREMNTDFVDSQEPGYADGNMAAQFLCHVDGNSKRKVYPRCDQPGEYFILGRPEYWTGSKWQNLNMPGRVRSGHQLSWDSPNIAFEIQHTGHGMKYGVVLKNSTFATNVRWALDLVGLTWDDWQLRSDTAGQVVTVFHVPTMRDADGTIRQVAASYADGYLTFTPDYSGLVYPIEIDPTFTDGYGGDVQTYIDTYTDAGAADTNYGGDSQMALYEEGSPLRVPLLKFTLDSIPDGSTVNSATLYLYERDWGAGAYTATVHRILAANDGWGEGTATWNYLDGSSTRWAGDTGGDGGSDAGCTVSGTDYNATSMGTLSGDGDNPVGTEYTVSLSTAQVEAMLTADYGLALICTSDSGSIQWICSSDNSTPGYRPKLVVVYEEAGGLAGQRGTMRGVLRGVGRGI